MEQNSEVGKVNISQATYELLKDDSQFTFESRGKIQARGRGKWKCILLPLIKLFDHEKTGFYIHRFLVCANWVCTKQS